MKDTTRTTLPAAVRTRALQAIAKVEAWNAAVLNARRMEALAGCPGRYEHALVDDPRWGQNNIGIHTLNLLEETACKQGWTLEQFYRAVGQDRPAAMAQGPHVMDWRIAPR